MNKKPLLSMKGISKSFGKVKANHNVNLDVYGGEIHALLGENGAGKSTLMNILSGVYTPDTGSILIHGKEIKFNSPKHAILQGVGMIYQHFKLIDAMTARENIMLGQRLGMFLNSKKVNTRINDIINRFELEVNLDKRAGEMSVGEKQSLEILKVLYRGADILILDEPTAVFTPQETKKLFKIMNKMKEEGCAIIFISHKMDEVMEICDRITVLRKGETVKTLNKSITNPKELTELMVGRPVDLSIEKSKTTPGDVVLKLENVFAKDSEINVLRDISFELRSGEILGIAGISGCGQKELCETIAGIYPVSDGKIFFEEEDIVGKNPKEIINKGISMSFIPEDRLGMGLVGSMDIVDNLLLKEYQREKGMFINRKSLFSKAKKIVEELEIKTPDIFHPIKNLSGGNIQKILLGRELEIKPKVLIMAYPVRGLDINTCHTIYNLIKREKESGTAILFIGEDLDVLIELCDRIMVMYDGEIINTVNSEETSKEEIGYLMVGQKKVV